jgi:hypothetical protein
MNWLKYSIRSAGAIPGSTSADQHPESDAACDYELVLDPRFRTTSNWPATLAALRRIREYRPHVVIAEQVRDPRWIALAGLAPRSQLVHDGGPRHRRTTARLRGRVDHCPLGSTVWETISCRNGCKSFITYAIVYERRVHDIAIPEITAVRQDTPRIGRRRVSLAARGVGTRLISQPLTDRGQPATLTISRRSAGVITSSPRQRVAQADTTSRLAADYDNRIGRRPN